MTRIFLTLAALSVAVDADARDTRTVTEPKMPASCTMLKAQLVAASGIAPVDEGKLDTPRIQKALDGCTGGQAVELAADGAHRRSPASRCATSGFLAAAR